MDKKELEQFIIQARLKTYSSGRGKVKAAFDGSTQLEDSKDDWLYRDVYYTGKNTFVGLETVYSKDKPVFSMSYYGNWGDMTEEEVDAILRGALMKNPQTRLYKRISWQPIRQTQGKKDGFEGFKYSCETDTDSIDEIGGTETISKNGEQVYVFYYAGSLLI